MTPEQAIETLRETCDSYDALNVLEAETTRLRQLADDRLALMKSEEDGWQMECDELKGERDAALAETTRLREGLADAVDVATWLTGLGPIPVESAWPEMRERLNRARALLAGEPQTAGGQVTQADTPAPAVCETCGRPRGTSEWCSDCGADTPAWHAIDQIREALHVERTPAELDRALAALGLLTDLANTAEAVERRSRKAPWFRDYYKVNDLAATLVRVRTGQTP